MSMVSKTILIEGEDGKAVERTYYVKEKLHNPYSQAKGNLLEQRNRKVRQFGGRKKAPDERAYTWTMGYNNCVGRYSPGAYPRFSGSSLNRDKKLKLFDDDKGLPDTDQDTYQLACKMARKMRQRGIDIPGPISDFVMRRGSETQRGFELWLSEASNREEDGLDFRIHMLSARSRGKVKDKATAFFRASTGDRIFCTLTFIDAVDDRTGVAILNKFLISLRKEFGAIQYLWVAERQTKNEKYPSNIHFHLILNKRIPVRRWNAMWVLQQYNAGLVGDDKYGERVPVDVIRKAFDEDKVHKIFNPLDVKKVRSIGGLSMYLTKYITKQEQNHQFGCAVWHCSRRVSRLFTRATVGPSAFAYMKSLANFKVNKETGECWPAREVRGDFYIMIYANDKSAPLKYLREVETVNKWLLSGMQVDRLPYLDDDEYRKIFCKN